MAEEVSFSGFGPITQSKPTFHGGFGRDSQFVPFNRQPIELGSNNWTKPQAPTSSYPWELISVSKIEGGQSVPFVKVNYGEVDGTAPSGMSEGTDYLLSVGNNAIIYLILTFDGNGLMTSVTIDYGGTVPYNTNTTKYVIIGSASLVNGVYKIDSQEITQYVYTDQALYINNSVSGASYFLFADPRKLHITNHNENFVADINGAGNSSKIYLENASDSEYIEIKKDSSNRVVAVDGFSASGGQNFLIKADSNNSLSEISIYDNSSHNKITSAVSSSSSTSSISGYSLRGEENFLIEAQSGSKSAIQLFDTGSHNFLESKVDTGSSSTSVYGYSQNQAQNFLIKADSVANKSSASLYDNSNSNSFNAVVDSTSKVALNGYSNNGEQQFLIQSDSTTGVSQSTLFDSGSSTFLQSKIDTDAHAASVFGYASNQNFNFLLEASQTANKSALNIYGQGSNTFASVKTEENKSTVYGLTGYGEQNYNLVADNVGQQSYLYLNDQGNANYIRIGSDTQTTSAIVEGSGSSGSENFLLEANKQDDVSRLFLSGGGHSVELKVDTSANEGHLEIHDLNGDADYASDMLVIKDKANKSVKIDIPDNNSGATDATWQEIDICVNGNAMKMKVLGTAPYSP